MKKRIIILSIIALMMSLIGFAAIRGISRAQELGHSYGDLADDPTIVASVAGISITKRDLEKYRSGQLMMIEIAENAFSTSYQNPKLEDAEIIGQLIEEHILYREAKKTGFVVSDDYVQNYIDRMEAEFSNKNSQATLMFVDFINGQGITIAQYFDSHFDDYKRLLSIGRLRSSVVKGLSDGDEIIGRWNQYKADKVNEYS